MTKVVAFISEKGGVGKTTACYHIAVALNSYHGKRVLVVDADYQRGGISGRFFPALIEQFASGKTEGTTLYHKFQQLYSAGIRTPNVDILNWVGHMTKIDVIPSDPRLSTISVDKLPSTINIKQNNIMLLDHMRMLDYVLSEQYIKYDYILIDSHPKVSDVLRAVIFAADFCVSPVKLDRQSSIGVATIIGEISNVNSDVEMIKSLVNDLSYKEAIFSGSMGMMAREWGGSLKQSEQIELNRLRVTAGVFENYVTEGDGLRQAAAHRIPVYDVFISNANKQSAQFRALTVEFLEKCPL